jgi:aldose 1-epimerase
MLKGVCRGIGTTVAALSFIATLPAAAPSYSARRAGEVVQLEDRERQTRVSVIPTVGNIAFEMNVKGHDVLYWPYKSVDEFKAKPALSGIPLLAPFANRLDEPAFYANGKRYAFDTSLGNIRSPIPIHGFVQTTSQWHVVEIAATDRAAWVTSRLEFFREPAWIKQWPFAHTIEMTYLVQDGSLEVRTTIANLSADPMPVAIGFHPYFQLTDSSRDDWTIAVGARTQWLLAADKLPTGETQPVEQLLPNPARTALRAYNFDDVFGDLVRDDQGRATMSVIGPSQRLDILLGPKFRSAVIWAPTGRNFICFEPMAGVTNALNLAQKGLYKELQYIVPGGTWRESFWVKPRGF